MLHPDWEEISDAGFGSLQASTPTGALTWRFAATIFAAMTATRS
jgi:hypothetical protein